MTVLKPLCGAEPGLDRSLRSFCEQEYAGGVQIVFGVQHPADPALAVLEGLKRDYPRLDLTVVVDPTRHGASAKVSNLINMMRAARHDWLVLADSDVRVPPGYLAAVAAPLADPAVGIVTCPYHGVPRPGLWSLLGTLFVNDWFIPSVRVAALFGSRAFAFGATIAMRRDALDAIGGFGAIADQLADDYRLGELTRRRGQRTVLSHVIVDTSVDERTFRHLVQHGLRWLRTIRVVRPGGICSFCSHFQLAGSRHRLRARRRDAFDALVARRDGGVAPDVAFGRAGAGADLVPALGHPARRCARLRALVRGLPDARGAVAAGPLPRGA